MALNLDIWGKTLSAEDGRKQVYYPLLGHMLDTVTTSSILYDKWLSENLRIYLTEQFGGDSKRARSMVMLAAGLHDLGKCSPIFQGELLGARQNSPHQAQVAKLESAGLHFPSMEDVGISTARREKLNRHEKIGYWLTTGRTRDINSLIGKNWIQTAILGHHGHFAISYGALRASNQSELLGAWHTDEWLEQADAHRSAVEQAVGATLVEARSTSISHEAVILISGLIVLSDRLASNNLSVENSYALLQSGYLDLLNPEDYVLRRREFMESLCGKEIGFPLELRQSDVLGQYSPRGVQSQIPEGDGLWTVMAPTGAGKTEAALLRHTLKKENLIFLLPTKSTTDAMFERLRRTYGEMDGLKIATLAHGDAYLNSFYQQSRGLNHDDDHDSCGAHLIPSGLTNAGARLSAPLSVATIDQMVMGGLPMKWSHLRLLILANGHIVMDEAHLLDSYQITLIGELIEFLGAVGTRMTVLSATMPSALKQKLASAYEGREIETASSFPSEELFPGGGEREIAVDSYKASISLTEATPFDAHTSWATAMLKKYPLARLGIFVNTVNSAQLIADFLKAEFDDVEVINLHSRMLAAHRKGIVDSLLKKLGTSKGKAERIVLVGTQVIEMSLDVDLDLISTDICPAPALIQRMGRAWRDKSPRGQEERYTRISQIDFPHMAVHIAVSPDEKENRNPFLPYSKSLIQRALRYIRGREELAFPGDIQAFVETNTVDYSSLTGTLAEQDEIAQDLLAQMKANMVRSRIRDFRDSESSVKSAGILTESEFDEELLTRLISGDTLPLVLMSEDPEIQALGALPPDTDPGAISEIRIKAASVGLNRRLQRLITDSSMEPLALGKSTFGFFGELPDSIVYDKLCGLKER